MSFPSTRVFSRPNATQLFSHGLTIPNDEYVTQACSCLMACGLFAHSTHFEEPVAARRRSARSSRTLAGDVSSARRPSLLAVGSTAAQQFLQQLSPHVWHSMSMARRGSDYQRQAEQHSEGLKPVGAPGDQDGFFVETADEGQTKRRSTVRWGESIVGDAARNNLGSSTNTAKVLPTEGPSGGSSCKVSSP